MWFRKTITSNFYDVCFHKRKNKFQISGPMKVPFFERKICFIVTLSKSSKKMCAIPDEFSLTDFVLQHMECTHNQRYNIGPFHKRVMDWIFYLPSHKLPLIMKFSLSFIFYQTFFFSFSFNFQHFKCLLTHPNVMIFFLVYFMTPYIICRT